MDLKRWGKIIHHDLTENILYIEFIKNDTTYVYEIRSDDHVNNVLIKESTLSDEILLEFNDYSESGSYTNFTRKVNKFEYIYRNSKIVVTIENKSFLFMKKLAKSKKNFTKFLTLDIETRTLDNEMIPYCICYFDGFLKKSFYISDFTNSDEMIVSCLKSILQNDKYNDYIVYAHNLSKFDGVFILKSLFTLSVHMNFTVNIIKRDSDIINLTITSISGTFNITFRDSLLLLPSSLRKLAKSFGVQDKSIFPYEFVNQHDIDLNYSGSVPDFKYFDDISLEVYNKYSNKLKKNGL